MSANDFQYARVPKPSDQAVINTSASIITAKSVVKLDTANPMSGTQTNIGVTLAGSADYPLGVAVEDIPVGKAGRMSPGGSGWEPVVAASAITIGTVVAAAAAGQVRTQTSGQPQLGFALGTAAAQGDVIMVKVDIAKNA
jgi:predicted RecA/RadA family phage recombinase